VKSGRDIRLLSQAGFTLLEMLVVVGILALTISLGAPLLSRPSDNLRLQTAANDIIGALRLTRASAITRNDVLTFLIDIEKRTFESPATPRRSFPSEIETELKVAQLEQTTKSIGVFRFYPDGSSTGGDLVLNLHGKKVRVCVNWITGEARQADDCQ
jgi:general secretion pathway protein H